DFWPIGRMNLIPKRNERSALVHFRMSAGKAWFHTPRLAAEREPHERLRAQGLPCGMIPFMEPGKVSGLLFSY
ncbi:MAG: hypothetical protein KAJ98_07655, partial [Spirochaetaceae bacterium]|nr:hypothetical protein [Spirochaetaceae bacterium]